MSRLPTITPRDMVRALKRAGFIEHHQKGSHLYLWNPERNRMTTVPMHARDLKRSLMKAILDQAGLSEDDFHKLL
jgi:predicted RNA binding protein YcfA (HicA-like mRNA interferase family)